MIDMEAEAEAAAEAAAEENSRLDPFNYHSPSRNKRRKSAKLKTQKRRSSGGSKGINTMDDYYQKTKTSNHPAITAAKSKVEPFDISPNSRKKIVNWDPYKKV